MIKKLFIICEVAVAGAALSSFYISDVMAQAPTPVNCVTGCGAVSSSVAIVTGTAMIGTVATITSDPCTYANKTNIPVSYQTTTSLQLVGLSTGKLIYVCSLALIGSTATVFSLTSGTGTACATSAAAIMGSSTATNGISLAANGGLTLGSGAGTVAIAPASSELCIIQSGAGNLSGNLTYVQQ